MKHLIRYDECHTEHMSTYRYKGRVMFLTSSNHWPALPNGSAVGATEWTIVQVTFGEASSAAAYHSQGPFKNTQPKIVAKNAEMVEQILSELLHCFATDYVPEMSEN